MASKSRDMSDIYKSSSSFHCSFPRYFSPQRRVLQGGARRGPVSKPSFRKVLRVNAIHTAYCCRLGLPLRFLRENSSSFEKHITMADSTGRKLWRMRLQTRSTGASSVISNGWREFSYDHSLEENDELVFTLVSYSHFVVGFANPKSASNSMPRAMYPTREGITYPWAINHFRKQCLSRRQNYVSFYSSRILLQGKSKVEKVSRSRPRDQLACEANIEQQQSHTVQHCKAQAFKLPELTYLECKNPDGSMYLQILESDSDSEGETEREVDSEEEAKVPERNHGTVDYGSTEIQCQPLLKQESKLARLLRFKMTK